MLTVRSNSSIIVLPCIINQMNSGTEKRLTENVPSMWPEKHRCVFIQHELEVIQSDEVMVQVQSYTLKHQSGER